MVYNKMEARLNQRLNTDRKTQNEKRT